MAQTSSWLCQRETCRQPLVMVRYDHPYPLAGVEVLCLNPIKARCPHCNHISEFKERAKAG